MPLIDEKPDQEVLLTPVARAVWATALLMLGVAVVTFPDGKLENDKTDGGTQPRCVTPECKTGEGEVRCWAFGPLGLADGGPRWRGCNVLPALWAAGDQCMDAPCEVSAGHGLKKESGGVLKPSKMVEAE